ncbi:hypothetical protein ACQ4M3_13115 [Leptolyngbya sp. AN03gr2]|uniref:hypothetical protein n=1 Tax=unclassified Leptolyngbya TaxID=2650499 RepID=UPI003D323FE1
MRQSILPDVEQVPCARGIDDFSLYWNTLTGGLLLQHPQMFDASDDMRMPSLEFWLVAHAVLNPPHDWDMQSLENKVRSFDHLTPREPTAPTQPQNLDWLDDLIIAVGEGDALLARAVTPRILAKVKTVYDFDWLMFADTEHPGWQPLNPNLPPLAS